MKARIAIVVSLLVLACQGILFAGGKVEPAPAAARQLVIWGEWAAEPNKLDYMNRIVTDFMKDNPSVKVTYTPYDGEQLLKTLQTMLVSGAGDLPDMAPANLEWAQAGWFDPLNPFLDLKKFQPFVETDVTWIVNGKPAGIFVFPVAVDYEFIGYNPEIFAKVGIQVPADRTFTLDEFADVVKKINAAGYAVVADGAGNRDYVGGLISGPFLLSHAGPDAYLKLVLGDMDWSDARAKAAMNYLVRLRDAGFYGKNYLTMGIDEFHAFFHTKREAAMIMINTWYTGRAFKAQDQGGQDPAWHFQMLRYPVAKKGDQSYVLASVNGGPGILAKSKNKDIAGQFVRYWQNPKYAAAWAVLTQSPPAVRYTDNDIPADLRGAAEKWGWFASELNKTYGGLPGVRQVINGSPIGAFNDAQIQVFNQGLPAGLITVDKAIELLNQGRQAK
jgi:ABC-type glycerol-3-phosphate transport system substrate-binding protein